MRKLQQALPAAGLVALLSASMASAANQQPSGPALDKFIPMKLAGWKTDAPFDAEHMSDHTSGVTQTYTGKNESGLTLDIVRVRPGNRALSVPRLEQAQLGELPEGGGFASLQPLKDRKALVVYSKENGGGKLTAVAGKCVITIDGSGVKQDQLVAAANAIDLKGLDAACL